MTPLEKWMGEVEGRLSKATPGPWLPCLGSGNIECTAIHFEGNNEHPNGLMVCDFVPDYMLKTAFKKDLEFKPYNMLLIENAPTDLKKALMIIEQFCQIYNPRMHGKNIVHKIAAMTDEEVWGKGK